MIYIYITKYIYLNNTYIVICNDKFARNIVYKICVFKHNIYIYNVYYHNIYIYNVKQIMNYTQYNEQ